MNIKLENGKVSFNLLDLLVELEDEEKEEIVCHFAWHDAIWNEIKRLVREEYAATNYNPKIHELRLEFLRSDQVKENISRVIKSLLEQIEHLENDRRDLQKTIWKWQSWHRERWQYEPYPVRDERTELHFLKDSQVIQFLDSIGILTDVENPENVTGADNENQPER